MWGGNPETPAGGGRPVFHPLPRGSPTTSSGPTRVHAPRARPARACGWRALYGSRATPQTVVAIDQRDPFLSFAQFPSLEFLSLIHISEPTRLGMISYAVFCLKKKT